jgi:hypothetical protein
MFTVGFDPIVKFGVLDIVLADALLAVLFWVTALPMFVLPLLVWTHRFTVILELLPIAS